MAKITLNTIGSRYGSIDALNANFDAIETAVENTLSRDGTSPNAMGADLDMNGNSLLNVQNINGADVSNFDSSINVVANNIGAVKTDAENIAAIVAVSPAAPYIAANSTQITAVGNNITAVTAVGNDLNGAAITLDYGDLGAVNNPAYPTGVLGAIYDVLDEIQLVAAVDEEVAVLSANLNEIVNVSAVAAQINALVPTVEGYKDNAETAATNAATSESNAATSESNAATSESNASTSATNANNSAIAAAASETNAATSANNAAASYDSFDDRYLGAKSSAPTLDNDGNALLEGAFYWNSTSKDMWVWNGSSWGITVTSGALTPSDIGATVQAYDADTAKYDDATANFTGTLQNGGSNVVVDSDIGSTVQAYDANITTATNTQTLTNKTLTATVLDGGYSEEIFALGTTGSLALDPANGSIQTCALTGNPTFTDSLAAGESIVLMLTSGSSYTVTYPTITWVTSLGNTAPTLTANDVLVFWKVSTTLYGSYVGSGV